MDNAENVSIAIAPHAAHVAQAEVAYAPNQWGRETITLRFSAKGKESIDLLASALRRRSWMGGPPVQWNEQHEVTVGPFEAVEMLDELRWLQDIHWLEGDAAAAIKSDILDRRKKLPEHHPVTADIQHRALQAFDDAVSAVYNIERSDGEQFGRIHFYKEIRRQLASEETLMALANEPPDEEKKAPIEVPQIPDEYLSVMMLRAALQGLAWKFTHHARLIGTYGSKRMPIATEELQSRSKSPIPHVPEDKTWAGYLLKEVHGISYEESKAILDGIEAYGQSVRRDLELPTENRWLDASRDQLEKHKGLADYFNVMPYSGVRQIQK